MNKILPQYRVFFSWQSDKQEKSDFIGRALKDAVVRLKNVGIDVKIEMGGGNMGFISIEQAVRQKIRMCDIFVGDVTPVGIYSTSKGRKYVPNSNVMFELGIATETMCPENVFAVALTGKDFKFESLPFDVNHYSFVSMDENIENATKQLTKRLTEGIRVAAERSRRTHDGYFATWTLQKNIDSKKYLPDTYLENIETLEKVRYFAEPSKYYNKVWEFLNRCDFTMFNRGKLYEGEENTFKLKISKYDLREKAPDLETISQTSQKMLGYLYKKDEELARMGNAGWTVSHKLRYAKEVLPFVSAKYLIVLSDAGVGKTNFVCNLVQNLFRGDGIPYVYVNAYELSADYVAQSIAFEYNYIGSGSLNEVFCQANKYCEQHRQYMILVIDGLNEHHDYKVFVQNLAKVLRAMSNYPYVKAILTCRYDFYHRNMTILPTTLGEKMQTIELNRHGHAIKLENHELSKVVERYFHHFEIKGELHDEVKNEFRSNMLLLRLFCEAYRGKNVTQERFLRYDDVFERYYNLQCQDIQNLIKPIATDDIEDDLANQFFDSIVLWMIENKIYRNLSYNKILDRIKDNKKKFFPLFINSNLLVKKDLIDAMEESGEMINFTYEEVRDFLIARYLVAHITSWDNISEVIDDLTENTNNCAEGVRRFLYLLSKNTKNEDTLRLIKTKEWYRDTVKHYIWYVQDDNISPEDYSSVILSLNLEEDAWFLIRLINTRWNIMVYTQFNICIALDYLDSLDSDVRKTFIQQQIPSADEQNWNVRRGWRNNRKNYILSLGDVLANQVKDGNNENIKVLLRWLNVFVNLEQSLGIDSYATQLLKKYTHGDLTNGQKSIRKFNPKKCHLYAYDTYKYLMVCNKDLTLDTFLQKVGAISGYAKNMFTEIYNAIFVESYNVQELFDSYYIQEYQTKENFLLRYYSLPLSLASEWGHLLGKDKKIICFDSLSYGLPQMDDFVLEELFNRFDEIFQ